MTFKDGDKWIPSEFNARKNLLLVEKFTVSKRAQKNMEEYMGKTYPYKYRFVSLKDLDNPGGKYTNTDSFRYVLQVSSHTRQSAPTFNATGFGPRGMSTGMSITGFDYHFYDRKLDKHYRQTGKGSSYAIMTFKPVINTIIENVQRNKKR